ncbi:MAG: SAM-dependent DNA methyltransferase [Flavipsychrobacter sp.]|nr:SAM-dependent DNA methyltransferase [Flavipsychrobacter sp.]
MFNFKEKANFIWSVADLLRGDYKQADYGKVILPLTILRRLDCLLEPTKADVLKQWPKVTDKTDEVIDLALNRITTYKFNNRSNYDFKRLAADPDHIAANLRTYISGFSAGVRDILEQFSFDDHVERMDKADLLYMVVKKFSEIDLADVDGLTMGYIFEELIRKFAEISNETAGEHFTPREVIELMVNLLFIDEKDIYKKGVIRTLYDPTAGTGGMLSVAEAYIKNHNPDAELKVFGQEINPESYAICKSDMLIKGQEPSNIKFGDTLRDDQHQAERFNYMLANPPFGVDWKKAEKVVKNEHEKKGYAGRFGPGLPRINDGSLLFLLHMISKMHTVDNGGSRIGIVLNGSPLFTGGAGSGESEIRKWIIENDMLEAIVALPDQLFYNTGISTYIWILTNHKIAARKGKVQLINATSQAFFEKMTRSLGSKRNEISKTQIIEITNLYGAFKESEYVKILPNEFFGYSRITVERPELDKKGKPMTDKKGNKKADAKLRDFENVPLQDNIDNYFKREVLPHVPDAWIDHTKTKIGYEINFTRYFYKYKPLRALTDIRKDILALEKETDGLIKEIIK